MRNCIRNKLHTHNARKGEFAIDFSHNSNKYQIERPYTCEEVIIAKIRNIVIRNKSNARTPARNIQHTNAHI